MVPGVILVLVLTHWGCPLNQRHTCPIWHIVPTSWNQCFRGFLIKTETNSFAQVPGSIPRVGNLPKYKVCSSPLTSFWKQRNNSLKLICCFPQTWSRYFLWNTCTYPFLNWLKGKIHHLQVSAWSLMSLSPLQHVHPVYFKVANTWVFFCHHTQN